jgi:hypothetical protein
VRLDGVNRHTAGGFHNLQTDVNFGRAPDLPVADLDFVMDLGVVAREVQPFVAGVGPANEVRRSTSITVDLENLGISSRDSRRG